MLNPNLINLNNNIEMLREKLYILLAVKAPTDSLVVDCSQKLDMLLTEYEKSIYKGKICRLNTQ